MKLLSSLWVKITLAIVLLVLLIMVSVSYFFSFRELKAERREVRERMERIAKQIATIRLAETEGWYVLQDYIDNLIQTDFNKDIVYIAIFNESDSLAAYTLNADWVDISDFPVLSRDVQRDLVRRLAQGMVTEESKGDLDSVPVQIRDAEQYYGTVDVGFSLIDLNNAFARKRWANFWMLAIFSLIGVVTSAIMSYRIINPLGRLTSAMRKVSAGDLSGDVHVRSRDEIGELARTFNSMVIGLREKGVIESFSRELGFTFELTKVAELVTDSLVQSVNATRGILVLGDPQSQRRMFRAVWDSDQGDLTGQDIALEPPSGGTAFKTDESFQPERLKSIPQWDEAFAGLTQRLHFEQAQLIVPLRTQETLMGFVVLGPRKDGTPYTGDDSRFLGTLAGQAALAIENALLQEELTEQERLHRELEIARDVQRKLLPQSNPQIQGWEIDGVCLPATEIGGDYFDYFYLADNRLGVAIADVAGKGTSAAFYMAEIKGMMMSLSTVCSSPRQLLSELNRRMHKSLDPRVFATMIYAVVDLGSGEIRFARAGHDCVFFKRVKDGTIQRLLPSGIGLGLAHAELFDSEITEQTVRLESGDTFIMYTDGITEARNERLDEFGEDTLVRVIEEVSSADPRDIRDGILNAVKRFAGRTAQHDDITMVVIGRK